MLRSIMLALALLPAFAGAAGPEPVVVSYPGPRNISYLPVDLIPVLGFDRDEGIEVRFLHTGGGGVALSNLMKRNADFAVAGFPAAMSLRANGGAVVGIAPVDDAPLFVLMVRSDLKRQVRRVAHLKGRVVGVNTSSLSSKTTSQQLAELVLRADGVQADQVRLVPAGQTWREQSALILNKSVDAIMGDEPFASRLLADGQVFFLTNLSDPATARRIPGGGFLHATLEARQETLAAEPEKAARMVRSLRRTLEWMASHRPEEIVAALAIHDPEERESLLGSLRKYPHLYSRDARFSTGQLEQTQIFFHQTSAGDDRAQALQIDSMVDARWSGTKP